MCRLFFTLASASEMPDKDATGERIVSDARNALRSWVLQHVKLHPFIGLPLNRIAGPQPSSLAFPLLFRPFLCPLDSLFHDGPRHNRSSFVSFWLKHRPQLGAGLVFPASMLLVVSVPLHSCAGCLRVGATAAMGGRANSFVGERTGSCRRCVCKSHS